MRFFIRFIKKAKYSHLNSLFLSWETIKKATTTTEGTKVKKCTICKTITESASVPKIPGQPTVTVKNILEANNIKTTK